MKISELFGGFLKAAADAGIAIEADDAPPAAPAPPEPPAEPTASTADQQVLQAQVKAQQEALTAAQARIAAMEADARTARFTALAQGWYGETAAHLSLLETLAASGGEDGSAFQAYVTQQKATAEAMRQSKVFANLGSDRAGEGSAWATVEARAKLIVKENPGTTIQQARVQAMESDPDLYSRYEEERRGT